MLVCATLSRRGTLLLRATDSRGKRIFLDPEVPRHDLSLSPALDRSSSAGHGRNTSAEEKQDAAIRSPDDAIPHVPPEAGLSNNAPEDMSLPMHERLLIIGGSFGLREFTQIRYDAHKLHSKVDPALEERIKKNKVTLESEYEKLKGAAFDEWKNIRGPRPWEDSKTVQDQQR
ncbi:uncharacterized protein LOC128340022 isoform X2 [Hemicordylus capensis]|uniref:uncharacterized protein LOC128340022 isoform X2 n=1 Tax=Hemicordylus capensis TaxID=884348 RepID=UPI00230336A2|nr:uncharacterized protein LOC128340022 isoform X2 [Hemicordylus capensis]